LRFFGKAMQQDHVIAIHCKENSRYAICQSGPHFPQVLLYFPYEGHSQGPAELGGLDVLADLLLVSAWQFFQPLSDRLIAGFGTIKKEPLGQKRCQS
jgi:hypothetical protein